MACLPDAPSDRRRPATAERTVFVVDSDAATRNTVRELVCTMNLGCETFASGQEFLDAYDHSRPGCAILELRIPGLGGMQIQRLLNSHGNGIPVIFLTAYPDVSLAVEAMRAGAVNFLQKPIPTQVLWSAVQEAVDLDTRRREALACRHRLSTQLGLLTSKERAVLHMIGRGQASKEIAAALQVTVRSVQKHRASLIRKLGVSSLWDLVDIGLWAATDRGETGQPVLRPNFMRY